jgi:hypothetical protein
MKKPQFTARFEQKFKVSRLNKEKYATEKEAIASNEGLVSILPKFDKEKNPDLLGVAFDIAIANIVNANDDGILTATAKAITPNFVFKPINIEHNRSYVFGTVTNTSLTSFTDGSTLDASSIEDSSLEPFKISAGGILWKCVEGYMTEMIEEQNEPENLGECAPCCYEYAGSWEIGFDQYIVALGSKKLQDAEIVTDEARVKELSQYLKANGGMGMLPDGTPIYRVITGEVTSLGVGITTNPAAAVDKIFAECDENKKIQKNISQKNKASVILNTRKSMKIKELADITEDTMKEALASDMREFIKTEILKKDTEFAAKQSEAKTAFEKIQAEAEASKTKLAENESKATELQNQIVALSAQIKTLADEKAAKEVEETFNTRMAALAAKYNLDANLEKIVHSQIKGLDKEGFDKWATDFEVLASSFKKEEKKETPADTTKAAETIVSTASVKGAQVPNTPSSQEKSWSKYKPEVKFEKGTVTL